MTEDEAIKILAVLKAAYPMAYKDLNSKSADGIIKLWHLHFADIPYDIVSEAINTIIKTNKFCPTIAEVNDAIAGIGSEAYMYYLCLKNMGELPNEHHLYILSHVGENKDFFRQLYLESKSLIKGANNIDT